jgi:D-alanyl-D-alanine carboxypeptidase
MSSSQDPELRQRVEAGLREIGAPVALLSQRRLELFQDAVDLELAHVSQRGREHYLIPDAAVAWRDMRKAAENESIVLVMISGFRSFGRQLELINEKLSLGQQIDEILKVMAPPGCSEHHTGRAVDVGTPGGEPLSERFEETDAFEWLFSNAKSYGFRMSYPRGNRSGYYYEPWHWCYASP